MEHWKLRSSPLDSSKDNSLRLKSFPVLRFTFIRSKYDCKQSNSPSLGTVEAAISCLCRGFRRASTFRANVNYTKSKVNETKVTNFSSGILKLQVFGVFSKFALPELVTTKSVTLICLLTSSALLCGIQARDQVLQRAYYYT